MIHSDTNVTTNIEESSVVPFVEPEKSESIDGKTGRVDSFIDKHSILTTSPTTGDSVTSEQSTSSSDDIIPKKIGTVKVRPSFGKKKKQFVPPTTSTAVPLKTKSPNVTEEHSLQVDKSENESPNSPVTQDAANKENAPSTRTPEKPAFSAPKKAEVLKVHQTDTPQVGKGTTKNTPKKATGAEDDSNQKEQKKLNKELVKQEREQKRLEKEKAKLEKERLREEKRLELERKKAEREQKKMEKELKKLEKTQKNATKNKKVKPIPQTDKQITPSAKTETVNQENADTVPSLQPADTTDNTPAGEEKDPKIKSGENDLNVTDSKTDDNYSTEIETKDCEPHSLVDVNVSSMLPDKTDCIPAQKQTTNTNTAHVSRNSTTQDKKRTLPDDDKQDSGAKKFKPNTKNFKSKEMKPIKKGGGKKKLKTTITPMNPSTRGNSSKTTKRKAELPQASEPESKRSKPANYSGPVWVQCDNVDCQKWRNLKSISDPSQLPDNWTCSMSDEPDYNSCLAPEEVWSDLGDSQEFVESPFIPGSLVWAKMDGYPWYV